MNEQAQRDLLNRLKSVEGHIRGVQKMVEENRYCIDIIKQTKAIQAAIDRVNSVILDNHLQNCVTTAIRGDEPSERERVIAELLSLFEAQGRPARGDGQPVESLTSVAAEIRRTYSEHQHNQA